MIDTLLKDFLLSFRRLLKSPGFSLAVILCLGLGIGANTAVFSFANSLFLRPLPVREPDRLVRVYTSYSGGLRWGTLSYPDYRDFRERTSGLAGLVAERIVPLSLDIDDRNERIFASMVSSDYFRVLGINIALGRAFAPGEALTPGSSSIVVLSHALWQRRFGGDPGILGHTVTVNGRPFSVVGVTHEEFQGTNVGFSPQLWMPLQAETLITPNSSFLESRSTRSLLAMGRLEAGTGVLQAEWELKRIAQHLAETYPESNEGTSVTVIPSEEGGLHPIYRGTFQGYLGLLQTVVAVVLLIACANVAALFLARARARRQEISVRLALGASRGRLIQQLLTESSAIALLAAALGLMLAHWIDRLVESFPLAGDLPLSLDFVLDQRVLLFTLVVSVLTGLLFGLAPAVQSSHPALVSALKQDSPTRGHLRSRLRDLLVISQVTLSLSLLICAGLFVRSLRQAGTIDVGFNPDQVAVATVELGIHGYDQVRGTLFYQQLVERISALPGTRSTSLALTLPLGILGQQRSVAPEGYEASSHGDELLVDYTVVTPRYFETLDIPLFQGRDFRPQDNVDSPLVAIVNQILAERFWHNEDPVGKRLQSDGELYQVIGVARNSKYTSLGETPKPFLYLPLAQHYRSAMTILARTSGDPAVLLPSIGREVQAMDNALAVFGTKTLHQHLSTAFLPARTGATVLGAFSLLAVLLAALGLYGTLAWNVSQRVREIGIRMSLGAQERNVLKLIIAQGVRLTSIGIVLGLVAAAALTRFLSSLLYGVDPLDPLTFLGASFVLSITALTASYLPARRAVRINPVDALRHL